MSEVHLKPRQYYVDQYDRHTVEQCRGIEKSFGDKELPLEIEGKKIDTHG